MRLCDLPCKSDQFKIRAEDPLTTAINALARGLHTLLVVDEHDRLRGLITASRVLSLVSALAMNSKLLSYPVSLFVDERATTMHYEYPIEAALQLMAEERKSHLVIVDGLKVVGLLTHRCLLSLISGLEIDLKKLASKDVPTLLTHSSLAEALKVMRKINYYEVPILEEEVVGIVRLSDVISEVIGGWFEKLKLVKVIGKSKLISRGVRSFSEAIELALKEDINLLPVLKDDGSYSFVKLEDLFVHLVKEHGAFKVAETVKLNLRSHQKEGSWRVMVPHVSSR
ncbi:MAG: CBS domain-containing protein [Candidatus Nezhaarchaeales archaeon]